MDSRNEELKPNFYVEGSYKDTIKHADGSVEVREGKNLIVNNLGVLISALLKGEAGYSGLKYWAVGSGSATWDTNGTPAPTQTDPQLTAEIARKAITPATDIKYVTDDGSGYSATPTNTLEVKLTFTEAEAVGSWREFALFGGNASITANSGQAINRKTHAILTKTATMQVTRQIRFKFIKV